MHTLLQTRYRHAPHIDQGTRDAKGGSLIRRSLFLARYRHAPHIDQGTRDAKGGSLIRPSLLLALGLGLLLGAAAHAVKPTVKSHSLYSDFSRGEAAGTALSSSGAVTLAPALDELASLDVQRIWSLARAPGGALYAGTGDDGRIYRVAVDGTAELLFDSPEVAIHALAVGPDGSLYAGTAPDGLVYRLKPSGRVETLAHTDAHYVWDLAFDARGQVLAATGEPARVLRLGGDGELETLLDPGDRHVMSLARRGDHLYAATAGAAGEATADASAAAPRGGRIYEIDVAGRGRLLAETEYREVGRLVAGGDGLLYAVAVSPVSGEDGKAGGAVLRVDPAGAVAPIWKTESMALDLALDGEGRLVVAVSEPGRLFRLTPDGQEYELVRQFDDFTPHRLLPGPEGLVTGGGQSGRLVSLRPGLARRGHYDGPAEDFGAHARWGALEWWTTPPEADLEVTTRSGNSREPDDTWSPWSDPLERTGASVDSPAARFLQYRVAMESDGGRSPRLEQVRVTGEQVNLPPQITELTTYPHRPGQKGANHAQDNAAPRNRGASSLPQRKSLRLVRWQATDPNGDDLTFDIYLRSRSQTTWKLAEEGTDKSTIIWDTENMPEGITQLRLVASDRPDNADGRALTDEWISDPFPIDNSPPRVTLQARGRGPVELEVVVEDAVTAVRGAQYAVDYGDRKCQIEPADGIFDRRRESARLVLADLEPGEHVISVQAWDELENVGVGQVIVQVD